MGRSFDGLGGDAFATTADSKSAVLSDAVWRDGFGRDPNILGRVIKLNGDSFTVIGVMPRGFQFPFNTEKPQIWIPILPREADKARTNNANPEYHIIARLKDGVSIGSATAGLKVIQSAVAKEYTDQHAREGASSVILHAYGDSVVESSVREAWLALLAASSVLWLIACVNVTNLLLARAASRQGEIAMLGASRWRTFRQLIVEGLVLSVVASILSLGLVFWL